MIATLQSGSQIRGRGAAGPARRGGGGAEVGGEAGVNKTRARSQNALVFAVTWAGIVLVLLALGSGFAGGVAALFGGSLLPWLLALSVIAPFIRWYDSR